MWNNKKNKKVVFHYVKLKTYYHFKLDFQKVDQYYRGHVVNPRHQNPQGQSVAKTGTPLYNILVWNVNIA